MRLDRLTPSHVRRAVGLYFAHAWPEGASGPIKPRVAPDVLAGAHTMDQLLARFEQAAGEDERLRRYSLRLGNFRYPFMKFVVQEYLVGEEFFFSVDTHDNLDVRPDSPDYAAWEELKAFNRELRDRIEADWEAAGLPTNHDLRTLVEELALVEREGKKRKRLLVVDDERNVARGLAALLRARGYDVELAYDGREALRLIERGPLPDLVLLDYEMPFLDGEEVLRRVRADPRTAKLRVLMATASTIELDRIGDVSGLLRKPYPRDILFAMLARLLPVETADKA